MAILEAKGLTKTFGPKVAVNGINLTVDRGQFVAFLGPNGAGKSTTIGMLTGLIQPTSGTITVADHTPGQVAYRQQIGVVFQDSVLDRQLTVNENLRLRARMYQHPDTAWFDQLIKQFDLAPILNQTYGTLSGGQRRRTDIARALLNHPQILFLDEPSTGLDIQTRQTIWSALAALRVQTQLTVILTTHYLEETENADLVYVIDRGEIIAADTVVDLKNRYAAHQLTIQTTAADRVKTVANQAGLRADIVANEVHVNIHHPQQAIALLTELTDTITDFEFHPADMNTIFVTLTGKEIR